MVSAELNAAGLVFNNALNAEGIACGSRNTENTE